MVYGGCATHSGNQFCDTLSEAPSTTESSQVLSINQSKAVVSGVSEKVSYGIA